MKELKEFRVFRENENFNYEEDIIILRSQDIEVKRLCETYGKYGQKSCCDEAGCYTLDNSYCGMEVLRDILSELKITLTEDEDMDFDDLLKKYEKIEGFETAKEAVEQHTECECYEYWDGSNYRSITIKIENGNGESDLREISDDEAEEILTEYEAIRGELNYIDGRDKTVNSGKHSFLKSRMQGFYPMALVGGNGGEYEI